MSWIHPFALDNTTNIEAISRARPWQTTHPKDLLFIFTKSEGFRKNHSPVFLPQLPEIGEVKLINFSWGPLEGFTLRWEALAVWGSLPFFLCNVTKISRSLARSLFLVRKWRPVCLNLPSEGENYRFIDGFLTSFFLRNSINAEKTDWATEVMSG
jgi:hypothetical protein